MIRRAVVADAAAVAHVHRSSRAEAYQELGGPLREITDASWTERLAGDVPTWVWEDAGVVLGFVSIERDALKALYVLPGAQGRGVGEALLAEAVEAGAASLWVYEANAGARRFYERHGWTPVPDSLYEGEDWRPRAPALRYRRG